MPLRADDAPWFSSTIVSTLEMCWVVGATVRGRADAVGGGDVGATDVAATDVDEQAATSATRTAGNAVDLRTPALCPVAHTVNVDPQHAFSDDALGELDGIALAARIRDGELSRRDVIEAAVARLAKVDGLNAVQLMDAERALAAAPVAGPFSGVPTFIKDNVDVAGWPTNQGSEAFTAKPAKRTSVAAGTVLSTGLVALGKSRLPEMGWNATTEFMTGEPVRNPWNPSYSSGASSGGAAALVASGVVPIAHANDGGGSIRIPAAACGLVGLKPTRGRWAPDVLDRVMPLKLVNNGALTRTVRDTAHFLAHTERLGKLPPIGLVEGPSSRRLRVGLVLDAPRGSTDAETRAAVLATSDLLADLGHTVEEVPFPVDEQFGEDFALYWGFLASFVAVTGPRVFPGWDPARADSLTLGARSYFSERRTAFPGALRRLRASKARYAAAFASRDLVLSPALSHTTPEIGHLSPRLPFDLLAERLRDYVGFTPVNNAAGSPGMSLPLGQTSDGRPIGVHFSAAHGDERTLLEIAYELEQAQPFRRVGQTAG
jgi:amidase